MGYQPGATNDRGSILTPQDFARSWTSGVLPDVTRALKTSLGGAPVRRMLDVGCGYGGIAATLQAELRVDEVHGVDIDPRAIDEAQQKGVRARLADVGTDSLPFDDDTFDLVICFGMLDYLPWYDVAVSELSRVLTRGGTLAVVLPNLGSWHNRLALLFGFQPRDVEFCSTRAVGLAPFYGSDIPSGHVHTPTLRAFREFMALMGLAEQRTVALHRRSVAPRALQVADSLLGRLPSLARRFLYIGTRARDPEIVDVGGWWKRAG